MRMRVSARYRDQTRRWYNKEKKPKWLPSCTGRSSMVTSLLLAGSESTGTWWYVVRSLTIAFITNPNTNPLRTNATDRPSPRAMAVSVSVSVSCRHAQSCVSDTTCRSYIVSLINYNVWLSYCTYSQLLVLVTVLHQLCFKSKHIVLLINDIILDKLHTSLQQQFANPRASSNWRSGYCELI